MPFYRKEAERQLASAIERTRARQDLFSVLMLRLGGVRALRKHVGYDAADRAMREAEVRLRRVLDPGDWLGRLSDEDFLIVSFDCNSPSCAIKGSTATLGCLRTPLELDALDCDLEPRVGIALYPADGHTADQLLSRALAAVDQAQERDEDPHYAFFCGDTGARARDDFVLQQALRRAISKGEFALHLQPKFLLGEGRLIGAEALLRWPQADGSTCPPGQFIPVAERGRLMRPLGRWVYDAAARIQQGWRARGLRGVPIAINVAADQLASDDWVASVADEVAAGRLRPGDLVCEITESVALNDGAAVTARLRCLHELGIPISVDDFGVGYSNLAALTRFPFDEVKIDRSLIAGLGTDELRQSICRAVATMGRDLGMAVLAEGVETPLQAEVAQEIGCRRTQGFHFGRPVPVDAFEARWLGVGADARRTAAALLMA